MLIMEKKHELGKVSLLLPKLNVPHCLPQPLLGTPEPFFLSSALLKLIKPKAPWSDRSLLCVVEYLLFSYNPVN